VKVKGGRLEFLVPHLLRSQLLRPGFVRLSLRLGAARAMPGWAKLQFLNCGVDADDLDRVLGGITSLPGWVDAWESAGREHEALARRSLAAGRSTEAREQFLKASAAFNFAQYVLFLDVRRKRSLHEACVNAYAQAAPLLDPPARPFEVPFRRRIMRGYLRVPAGPGPHPVVVMFHGTNSVKEELHWWSNALLARGLATVMFDGPGFGETFHRLSMVAEPRPVGLAIVNAVQAHPDLDTGALAFFGQSLGGYMAIRMAAYDPRIKAVAAVSPPYSADVYWNVTLSSLRRELAALYGLEESEMGREIHRITLAAWLERLRCPLFVSGGGRDLITPGEEAWRIYEEARCEREIAYYPHGGHDCFNVLSDLRPRIAAWLTRQLEPHRVVCAASITGTDDWHAGEAVHPDFEDALRGDLASRSWNRPDTPSVPERWGVAGEMPVNGRVKIVNRHAAAHRA
jgi:2,6-dihydroxypseudooxynicotine hydrolase